MLLNNQLFPIILYKKSKFKKYKDFFYKKLFYVRAARLIFKDFYNRVGVCKKIVSNFVSRYNCSLTHFSPPVSVW